MTITASSTNFSAASAVTSQNPTFTIPSNVPAGATIIVGIFQRSNNTEVATSVSDPVNGAYTEASVSGIGGGSTGRGHLFYFNNSQALSGSNLVVTVAWQTNSVITQAYVGWISSDLGAMAHDGNATAATFSAATAISSNTISVTGAGGLIGVIASNNNQSTAPGNLGTNEAILKHDGSAGRLILMFQNYSAAGTEGFEGSGGSGISIASANGVFLASAFKEPTAGTVTPGQATLTLNGRAPTTSAFQNVRIREVLVNASGQAVGSATDIGLRVWYGGICRGAPDVSLNGMTTDANGTTSWSIATGTLGFNDAIFYVAQNSVSYSTYTAARLVPSYES